MKVLILLGLVTLVRSEGAGQGYYNQVTNQLSNLFSNRDSGIGHSGYGGGYDSYGGGGYGYDHCDCKHYDVLAVAAGSAALCALGLYLIVSQLTMSSSSSSTTTTTTGREDNGLLMEHIVTASTINMACDAIDSRMSNPLVQFTEARSYGGGCDCFEGILGALAGFAALGGLLAYALAQAAAAMSAATSTTTTTTTTTGTGREAPEYQEPHVLDILGRLYGVLTEADLECSSYQLCEVEKIAATAGHPYNMVVPFASLPMSWYITRGENERMAGLCRANSAITNGQAADCHELFPKCQR